MRTTEITRRRRLRGATVRSGRAPVESVKHLDDDEGGERHGGRVVVAEDLAVDALEQLLLHRAVRVVRLKAATTLLALALTR